MPITPTYPGVYVEEIPSGVRTITGVATSITAFVGSAAKGPTNRAELVLSWAEYERKFGGLDPAGPMSYSVYHFFINGGQRAYIVRVVTTGSQTAAENAVAATITLDGKLKITASSPGDWGNDYAVVTSNRPAPNDKRFRLVVMNIKQDKKGIPVETFENLSMDKKDPRFVENVLKTESAFVLGEVQNNATDPPKPTVRKPQPPPPAPPDPTAGEIPVEGILKDGTPGKPLVVNEGNFETAILPTNGTGGVFLLDRIDLFNLLCVPGETTPATLQTLEQFCRARRAFLIADSAQNASFGSLQNGPDTNLTGTDSINAAFYFPWLMAADPLQENRPGEFPPSGFIAGLYARTDANRGVWKAPAGTEASLTGALGPKIVLTNDENGVLNPKAINCIRSFPVYGTIAWGARTLQGNDEVGSEWKYIPVRRTALFIEESLFRALKWVVFEPNDEPLWAQIRLNVGAFMHDMFRQGAFQGTTPRDAYFVKCDKETTTQSDINRGIVNIVVGFAPLKPAEFVIVKIQQMAGQIEV
ncbi:MAG TPA: phage tail protein [Blastocatellia bacterium]|nr:phage tail protein [Blastocatellia bacterium]